MLEKIRQEQKRLIYLVLENLDRSSLPVYLSLSYLGARICYAETHPLLLFKEEKFKDLTSFRSFLLHLKKAGHFSVFAHTPILVKTQKLSWEEKFKLAKTFFKIFWHSDEDLALFNLRHLAENLDDQTFFQSINLEPLLEEIEVVLVRDYRIVYQGPLSQIPPSLLEEKKNFFANPEIIILRSFQNFPFNWIGVITHNFSRIFSHQLVRHTWLNFNQRSHRYTKVDKFVLPKSFKEKEIEIYKENINKALELYQELCHNIKRESARFIVPQGVATTVLATGPEFVWKDFINKRAIPQAQEEIRDLAIFLKNHLNI